MTHWHRDQHHVSQLTSGERSHGWENRTPSLRHPSQTISLPCALFPRPPWINSARKSEAPAHSLSRHLSLPCYWGLFVRIFSITSCRRRRGDGKWTPTCVSHSVRTSGGPMEIIDLLASAPMRRLITESVSDICFFEIGPCFRPYYSSLGFSHCSSQIFGRKLFKPIPVAESVWQEYSQMKLSGG